MVFPRRDESRCFRTGSAGRRCLADPRLRATEPSANASGLDVDRGALGGADNKVNVYTNLLVAAGESAVL
jgi:hypothetical protein